MHVCDIIVLHNRFAAVEGRKTGWSCRSNARFVFGFAVFDSRSTIAIQRATEPFQTRNGRCRQPLSDRDVQSGEDEGTLEWEKVKCEDSLKLATLIVVRRRGPAVDFIGHLNTLKNTCQPLCGRWLEDLSGRQKTLFFSAKGSMQIATDTADRHRVLEGHWRLVATSEKSSEMR